MNLRQLQYLVALDEQRHFGKAAEACFVSQPTLSTQLKKLEDELGVTLVERAPRRVLFTDSGLAILAEARAVLEHTRKLREIARETTAGGARSVRLGIFPTLAPYLLPRVLPALHRDFPELELLLVEEKTVTILEKLHRGTLDAVIVALPLAEDGLEQRFLFEEPFVLAVPASHRFADRKTVQLHDLEGERLLLLEDGHCLRDQALDVCALAGATERNGFRATSLETLRHMVATKVGMTLLPVLATQPPVARVEGLSLVPFAGKPPSRKITMAWRASTPMAGFLRQIADAFAALPKELLRSDG